MLQHQRRLHPLTKKRTPKLEYEEEKEEKKVSFHFTPHITHTVILQSDSQIIVNAQIDDARQTHSGRLKLTQLGLKKAPTNILEIKDLIYLDISENHLTTLDPLTPILPQLKTLNCSKNQLTELPTIAYSSLFCLVCSDNELTHLPAIIPGLMTLYASYNVLSSMDAHYPVLRYCQCTHNQLTSIHGLDGCDDLTHLDVQFNHLTTIPLNIPRLEILQIEYNLITDIKWSAYTLLRVCSVYGNKGDLALPLSRKGLCIETLNFYPKDLEYPHPPLPNPLRKQQHE